MAEARASDPDLIALVSEPFQATSYTDLSGGDHWGPTDSTTLESSRNGVSGAAVERSGSPTASSDATALAALPAGHSVARFMRYGSGHNGIYFVGDDRQWSTTYVRLAARWYQYYSPDATFSGQSGCTNSKQMQLRNNMIIDLANSGGGQNHWHLYGWYQHANWSGLPAYDSDSYVSGPGADDGPIDPSDLKGKWWRYECVLRNREASTADVILYAKNVTDNGSELTRIKWSDGTAFSDRTPPNALGGLTINAYRESASGWYGFCYYMVAGWTTDEGQRIGAASEVEGGAAATRRGSSLGGLG